jgi:hypothetical protein
MILAKCGTIPSTEIVERGHIREVPTKSFNLAGAPTSFQEKSFTKIRKLPGQNTIKLLTSREENCITGCIQCFSQN